MAECKNKIITFLGTRPLLTTYEFDSQCYTGSVFAEALHQFARFDQMLVFLTEDAMATTWPVLAALNDVRIKPVMIPLGINNDEMWSMFDLVLEHVNEADTVIFDITHGLRSMPFLSFLFAAFLKFARGVTIEAVYYGAFELGDPRKNIPAPVFDLSEFVNMLDWLTATDRFVLTGDGSSLTELLRNEIPPGVHMGEDNELREIGNHLRKVADSITGISRALQMVRPIEVLEGGTKVVDVLAESKEVFGQSARPFSVLAERIEASYGQFGLPDALEPSHVLPSLEKQLNMVRWYLDHQQAVQATLLMREWLVSALMALSDTFPLDSLQKRLEIETVINNGVQIMMSKHQNKTDRLHPILRKFADPIKAIKIWSRLSQMRNDIAHCGMRENSQTAERLVKASEHIYKDVEIIAKQNFAIFKPDEEK